jgi:hypothetical protein
MTQPPRPQVVIAFAEYKMARADPRFPVGRTRLETVGAGPHRLPRLNMRLSCCLIRPCARPPALRLCRTSGAHSGGRDRACCRSCSCVTQPLVSHAL